MLSLGSRCKKILFAPLHRFFKKKTGTISFTSAMFYTEYSQHSWAVCLWNFVKWCVIGLPTHTYDQDRVELYLTRAYVTQPGSVPPW